ncbi:MAG: ShlB/FhaC/HecB family hemolysin secretion/activation protein [Sphingomonas sp.]
MLDRVDPGRPDRERRAPEDAPAKTPIPIEVDAPSGGGPGGEGTVLVGAVTLIGLKALTPADFADIIVARVGQTLGPAELAALATAIAGRARARGYLFASAWIEPQRVSNGVLVVHVDEGRIDEIRFDGPVHPSVLRTLAPLADGRPARIEDVERRLLIAGDIDGVRISGSRFVRENGKGVLIVRVTQDNVAVRLQLSNDGTRPLGPAQARIDVDFNAVLFSDDAFTVTWSGTPVDPRELQFARVRYSTRLSPSGTELIFVTSGSRTQPAAYLDPLKLESRSWYAGAEVIQPLMRRRRASLWLGGEFGVRDLVQRRGGVVIRHDRTAVARVTLYGNSEFAGGRLRAGATVSQGFGAFGATGPGDPLASRADADGRFTSVFLWSDWTTDVTDDLSVRLALQSQLATDPLLVTEETGLGGTSFLRGYDWSERSGDQGTMGSVEVRYVWTNAFGFIPRAQLYAFIDGGTVTNLQGGLGSGELASAGGGIRADLGKRTGANFEVAVPLTGPRYDTGDESAKLNFRVVQTF